MNCSEMRARGVTASARARLSVIIPTKYRPAVVERTVESVFRQTVLPWQVIIIDQSSTEETQQRIEKLYATAPSPLQQNTRLSYLHDATVVGAAEARNRGMDLAEGNTWLFLDDDVRLEPEFIEHLLDVYDRYPAASGVSGVFTNYLSPSWVRRAWSRAFLCGPFHDERQPIYWDADRLRASEPLRVRKFTGALMSFRAEAIRSLRFDENIRTTGAEDADFCARLRRGSVLLIAPTARVFHERAAAGRADNHWIEGDLEWAYYLYRRNWDAGVHNRLCFAWLIVGYAVAATLASIRQRSFAPWRGFFSGIREGGAHAAYMPSRSNRK